ncbi:hypothetical protein RQP46_007921 [Phenoliferia psychrophenolica]
MVRGVVPSLAAFASLLALTLAAPAPPLQHAFLSTPSSSSASPIPRLEEASISQLLEGLASGVITSEGLTQRYLDRINIFDDIRATLSINPFAIRSAREADSKRRELGGAPLPAQLALLGIPFLVKDNIAIPDEAGPTTAGSYALVNTTVIGPSTVVQRLLDAGAVLLGTTNLDEFAQAKGDHPWGWSARGGQMHSIYGTSEDATLDEGYGDVCGSSGGSALSIALGLAAFSLGTQTGVSIVCPAGRSGIVGLKPGRGGMSPMGGVIPISKHLDVVGPLTRTVADAEIVWRIIKHPAGWSDPELPLASRGRAPRLPSQGIRIGVPKNVFWDRLDDMPPITESFSSFLAILSLDSRFSVVYKEVANISAMTSDSTFANVSTVTSHELKMGLNHYFNNWTITATSYIHTLSDIINFNLAHRSLELPAGPFAVLGHPPRDDESYSDQSFLLKSNSLEEAGWKNGTYRAAKDTLERVGWTEGLEEYFLGEDGVDIMLVPTEGISGGLASLSAVPQITLPLGFYPSNYTIEANATWPLYPYPNMPFGISLMAARGHEEHEFLLHVARQALIYFLGQSPPAPDVKTETFSTAGFEMRWYTLPSAAVPGPAIVYAHGGGRISGGLKEYEPLVKSYVQRTGVPFLLVDISLAPEHPGAKPSEDCFAALQWLISNATRLQVDTARISLMGDSGGGGIAAGTVILARDAGIALATQILIYPMLDDRTTIPLEALVPFATWDYAKNYTGWHASLGDSIGGPDVSPIVAPARLKDFVGLPQTYIECGELDIFCVESVEYAKQLMLAGVGCELHIHPKAMHGYDMIAQKSAVTKRAVADRLRFISAL